MKTFLRLVGIAIALLLLVDFFMIIDINSRADARRLIDRHVDSVLNDTIVTFTASAMRVSHPTCITAPTGYEMSSDSLTWSSSIIISSGSADKHVIIYCRRVSPAIATEVGTYQRGDGRWTTLDSQATITMMPHAAK